MAYITGQGRHRGREDVIATGYGNMPDWAVNNPIFFWKMADMHERANGATYREHEIALPSELTQDQQIALALRHVADIAGNRPYQYAVHAKCSSLEGWLNTHLHLMVSDRMPDGIERPPEQMFRRYNSKCPERGGCRKASGGMNLMELRDSVLRLKKQTAVAQNEALIRYGHEARVDHRSLREQGLSRKPERHLGPGRIRRMSALEKKAYLRARYRDDPGID
ncbi:MobA/MobL family protein [Dyella sp. A6]|uniref:MobA/MobL family protein n=1 Tax=Dyella aluminiiresistens TaxID=3069105 RepID=UPI002E78395A|nr:MobA/MobL family protein [Dyella sp. A6]